MKLYVLTQWTNAEGSHEVGDEVELSTGSEQEQAEVERLVNQGILSKAPVLKAKKSR